MKRRRLNLKLLLSLLGVVAVLGVGVHFLHGAQVSRSADVLLDQAKKAEKAGDQAKAQKYLQRYLVYKPQDTAVLTKLGELIEEQAKDDAARSKAVAVYEKALRLEPSLLEPRRRAIALLLGMDHPDFPAARPHLELLVKQQPDDAEAREQLGQCLEAVSQFIGRGDQTGAAEEYREAIKRDPKRVSAYSRLAGLLRERLSDTPAADRLMNVTADDPDGLIASNPDLAEAYLARARYRERYSRADDTQAVAKAEEDIAKALSLAPDDVDALVASATLERDRGNIDAARRHLEHALEQDPKRATLYQSLADLELRANRREEAVKWLEKGIEALPDELTLRYVLATTLAQIGRLDDARTTIEKLEKGGLRSELVQYLTAHVLMAEGKFAEAAEQLEKAQLYLASSLDTRELNKRVLMMLGDCYKRLNDKDRRYDVYRRAVAIELNDDTDWQAQLGLAETLREMGKLDEAIQQYLRVLPRRPELRLPVAQLLTLQNTNLPAAKQRWPVVENLLDDVERTDPKNVGVPILRANILAARDQAREARALLEATRKAHPDRVEPWLALAGLAEKQQQDPVPILDAADKALGPRLELLAARAAYWGRRRGPGAAEALARIEEQADDLAPADRPRLWRDLALAYTRVGAPDRALQLGRQVAERLPDDLGAQLTLFDMAIQAKDDAGAKAAVEALRKIDGDQGTLWRYAEAVLLTRQARELPPEGRGPLLDQARDQLAIVARERPTWSRAVVAQGDVAAARGDKVGALRDYLRAVDEMNDRSPGALIAACQLLYEEKRYDAAGRMVEHLRKQDYPISGGLRRLVAEISFRNRDYADALKEAQQVVSDQSDNYRDLIWLGRLRWANGQDAEPVFRRAVEKARDAPEAWVTLVVYLAKTNRLDQAKEVFREAEVQIPPGTATLLLAEGHDAVGQADRARELYDEALRAKPDDLATLKAVAAYYLRGSKLGEARSLLERLVEKYPRAPEAAAARQTLALILASGGTQLGTKRALEILGMDEKSAPDDGDSLDDLRTKAKVLALQPNRVRRQEAINILKTILLKPGARGEDRLLLAQLHEANGEWDDARQALRKLLQSNGENPTFLATYIRSLLRHDSVAEARAYLDKLEQVAGTQPGTVAIRARVLHAEGRDDEAVAELKKLAQADLSRTGQVAELLEELGQKKAAEEMYRTYARNFGDSRPQAALPLAGFLGRQGRVSEALDVLDQSVWGKLPDEGAANSSVVLLYATRSDSSQYDRVRARLEGAMKRSPDKISIQFDMANLLSLQGRYDEAASIYRKLFEREPTRGVALNNLAWMLCLQGGKDDEAQEAIEKAIELEGEIPDLLDTRALIRLSQGQARSAIEDLENALAVTPNSRDMYFHLAQAHRKAGMNGDARDAFRRATVELGLTIDHLHPLERARFTELANELGIKP